MRNYFRDTGIPSSAEYFTTGSAGELLDAPGIGKHYVIYDVLCQSSATLRETDTNGDDIIKVPSSASCNFTAPIAWPENKKVYSTAGNITITYSVES